jgi:hypothetical protein
MTAPIRSMAELTEALRQRRDTLDISHETIDEISGLQPGYAGKLLAPRAPRNLSYNSLGLILGALGVGLELVEDPEQVKRVKGRWQKRKPFGPRYKAPPLLASAAGMDVEIQITPDLQAQLALRERMKLLEKLTPRSAKSKGGKRRMKMMGKRARQAMAAHAARKRWGHK